MMYQRCDYCGKKTSIRGPHHKWSCPLYSPKPSLKNYLNVKKARARNYFVPVKAIKDIDIEPIAQCNLKCPFCQVPGWDRAKKTKPIDFDLFKKIIDQLPSLKRIKLQGMGEPLLNKDLFEFIKFASGQGIKTTTITNGTLLRPEIGQKLLDANLSALTFSIDGATKKTYESLRRNARHEDVLENIRQVCNLKRQLGTKTEIGIVCLVSNPDVLAEIPSLVNLAAELGVDRVSIKKRLKIWEQHNGDSIYSFKTHYIDSFSEYMNILDDSARIAEEKEMKLKIEQDSDYSSSNPCTWPFKSLYVSTEGKIVPCCALAVPETWNMGDLNEDKLETIWNNTLYKDLRKKIALNKIPKTCINCYRSV